MLANAPATPIRTWLYLRLNSLFGTPRKVERESYTRCEEIYETHTGKFLAMTAGDVAPTSRVLLIGCGSGMEIKWFAERCASLVAIDVRPLAIKQSAERSKGFANVVCQLVDSRSLPFEDGEFDVLFMNNVCEHIIHIEDCFQEYYRVLKPGGAFFNFFSPLFYSPFGAHLQDALKLPWGHLVFGVRSVVEIRNLFYPDTSKAKTWEELGLNRLTEGRYRRITARSGFRHEHYELHTARDLPLVDRIPLLRNLFILQVIDVLRKPAGPIAGKVKGASSRAWHQAAE